MSIRFYLYVILLSLSSFSAHSMKRNEDISTKSAIDDVKKHATLKLKDIIFDLLKNGGKKEIIAWLIEDKVFCINLPEFTKYYQYRTRTNTKIDSIKNLFTKTKNNIVGVPETAHHQKKKNKKGFAPDGYDRSYKIDCEEEITEEVLREAILKFSPPKKDDSNQSSNIQYAKDMQVLNNNMMPHHPENMEVFNNNMTPHPENMQVLNNTIPCYSQSYSRNSVDDEIKGLFGYYSSYNISHIVNKIIESGIEINKSNLSFLLKSAANNVNTIEYSVLKNVFTFLGPMHLLPLNMKCFTNNLRLMFHGFIVDVGNTKISVDRKCRLFYILNKPNNTNEEVPLACLLLRYNNDNAVNIYIFKDYWFNNYYIYSGNNDVITKKTYPNMGELVNDLAHEYEDYECKNICYNIAPDADKYIPLNNIESHLIFDNNI